MVPVLVGLLWLAAPGCTLLGLDDGEEQERLDDARALWAAQSVSSYAFTQRRLCFCIEGGVAVRVEVENGVVASRTRVDDGEPVSPDAAQYYLSVPDLFDFIEETLEREPADLKIVYDQTLGYPTLVEIDYVEMAIDDELTYEISAFTIRE
jgi:hypothetical protein